MSQPRRSRRHREKAKAPLIYQVQAEFDRVKADLQPRLDKLAVETPSYANPEVQNLQIAQNVMRSCLEATLNKMLPYGHLTAVDLAIRLASYALSTVPLEDQDIVVAQFMASFPDAHALRTARGITIETNWQMEDGRVQPNFPEG